MPENPYKSPEAENERIVARLKRWALGAILFTIGVTAVIGGGAMAASVRQQILPQLIGWATCIVGVLFIAQALTYYGSDAPR